jgi:DNA-directed RNA polymerase subunit H
MKHLDYNVKDYESFTTSEVNSMYQNKQLDMLLEKNQEDPSSKRKKKIYIRYYLGKTFRYQNIQEMIDDLFNMEEVLTKQDILYIITKDEPNESIMNSLKHVWEQENIYVIVHSIKRLQFCILDHVLVPPHRILSDEEANAIKVKYNITDDYQFPEISRFDPVALAICMRPGEICEIIRPSKTAIQAPYYRICV